MVLLKDKMSIFKDIEELNKYIKEHTTAAPIESFSTKNSKNADIFSTKNSKNADIDTFLLKEFSCFCKENEFFQEYGEKIVQYLDNGLDFPRASNGILDIFYAPYKTQLLLSALYTSEYLKLHNIFIAVPDFLHLKPKDLNISNPQKVMGYKATNPNTSQPEQPHDIIIDHTLCNTLPYDPPTSEERKSYYKKFSGKKVSRYWDRLFYSTEKNINYSEPCAIPFFLCNFTADLLDGNIDTGLKTNNIDIYKYFNIPTCYPNIADAKDSIERKDIMLKKYKLEVIFKLMFITRIIKTSMALEEFNYQQTLKLLTQALECGFMFFPTLLPYLSYIPYISSAKTETEQLPQNLISSFFSLQHKPEYYCSNADYLYNYDGMGNFIKELSDNMQNSQKNFFASLFINLGSLNNISESIVEYLSNDILPDYQDNSRKCTYFEYFFDNYGYWYSNSFILSDKRPPQQALLASAILKEYWNLYAFMINLY